VFLTGSAALTTLAYTLLASPAHAFPAFADHSERYWESKSAPYSERYAYGDIYSLQWMYDTLSTLFFHCSAHYSECFGSRSVMCIQDNFWRSFF